MCRNARQGRGLAAGLILACLSIAGLATAQLPYDDTGSRGKEVASAPARKPIYTNKRAFNLPVTLPERDRTKLSGLCLFWKTKSPGSEWTKYDTVPPTADKFVFKAQRDDEYWFIVATIGLDGHLNSPAGNPRYLDQVLKVVIDTKPPVIEVQSMKSSEGDVIVRCAMIDENPKQSSIRLICRGENGEIVLQPMEKYPDAFRVTRQDGIPVRVVGSDMCNNTVSQDVPREIMSAVESGPGSLGRTDSRDAYSNPPLQTNPAAPVPIRNVGEVIPETGDRLITAAKNEFPPIDSRNIPIAVMEPAQRTPANPVSTQPIINTEPLPPLPGTASASPTGTSAGASGVSGASLASRTLLNTNQASVHYRIDQVGNSGVGKVQIFISDDQGQTWKFLREDVDKRSPVDIKLPGEGLFGVSVVVTNGNGFGGTPPRNGESPASWIEVDTTKPFVQFQPNEILPNGGGLEIRWTASDKNMASEPITLYYSTTQGGPWKMIAGGLKNDGHYRWAIPKGEGAEFFFKIEAIDQVGNQSHTATNIPLVLDMTEPKGTILRVSGR